MKLLLTAFCAVMITSPLAFAGDKCEKKKCDKEKDEATMLACDKCSKHNKKKKEEKKEGTLLAGKKCDKKKKCDKDKEEATLA